MRGKMSVVLTIVTTAAVLLLLPEPVHAQRRRTVVVRRGPVVRTRVVVRPGHPMARSVNRTVVVHPARTVVAVRAPLVFLPVAAFSAIAVSLPPHERLAWQDTDTINREDDWTDCNFGVGQRGDALILDIDGRAQLDFAEVTFENGNVQVVDFQERIHERGLIRVLDFADGRRVMTVRLMARSRSDETRFTLYLRK